MDENQLNLLIESLRKISKHFNESLSRCEHCGNTEGFFTCDDCQHNKTQFADGFLDLANALLPGQDDAGLRMFLTSLVVDPDAPQDNTDLWQLFLGKL